MLLTEAACRSDFFVSYQATWGAIPVKPLTLPRCMHPRTAEDTFGVAGADGDVVEDGGARARESVRRSARVAHRIAHAPGVTLCHCSYCWWWAWWRRPSAPLSRSRAG